jgi:D-psicose/D-tagatose/L-ribulose 3-epimerase
MEMAVRLCGKSRLGYVHLGESQRGYMGSGSVDFTGLFRGLADIGYTGGATAALLALLLVVLLVSQKACQRANICVGGGVT